MSQAGVITARRTHMKTPALAAMQNITLQHLRPHVFRETNKKGVQRLDVEITGTGTALTWEL